ncbi:BtrH N-terminal domain-containing protein [Ruminiclostridium herbifermentans]|uniref:BtrH N-terminal domain-containing protein n=1 Tax=Ruminiclostridium herbifermentans TaxID=2488810 RepID=A0A4U7JJK5_9FIRM|nr:BtrH N-terminal domain-containing protein [Ruminiclostridium herbifermentans]QNU67454.1 BtrH N-terminal domain-containing protein [Ruminiclostridium herbifermentans]
MAMKSIKNVPRFFEPYVSDCFHNALSAQFLYLGLNPNILLADYLSFLYDKETGYMGVNYLYKYNTSVEFSEKELNTSFELIYFPVPKLYENNIEHKAVTDKDQIIVKMYIENNPDGAYNRVKELIDQDIPVVVAVDLFYIRYHRAYQKEHGLHYVVITGYNEEEGWYELFDKYKLTNSDFDGKLQIDEIRIARASENPLSNAIMGEYSRPIQNVWCELENYKNFKVKTDRIIATLRESCSRMNSEKEVLGYQCGFEAINTLISDLNSKKSEELSETRQYMFKTYYNETFKTISRSRKRFKTFINELNDFIPQNSQEEISNLLEESSRHWDICANLSLKLGITKKLILIDDIIDQLNKVIINEQKVISSLGNLLK